MVRKPEKGTGPKIFYLGAEDSVIRPEAAVRPLYYKEGQVHLRPIGAPEEDPEDAGRAARRLRRPARQAVGRRHGPLPALQGGRRPARCCSAAMLWLLGFDGPLVDDRGAGDLDRLHRAHRRRARRRPRAARALLLHPDAIELALVDGVGRVVPDRRTARSARLWLAGRLVRLGRRADVLAWPAIVVSRSSRRRTRASCSRRDSAATCGRGRTRRSTSSRSRARPAPRRCCSAALMRRCRVRTPIAAARHGSSRHRSCAHLLILIFEHVLVAEPDAASRARGRRRSDAAPTRRCSGAARSPPAACCRSLMLTVGVRSAPC